MLKTVKGPHCYFVKVNFLGWDPEWLKGVEIFFSWIEFNDIKLMQQRRFVSIISRIQGQWNALILSIPSTLAVGI